MVAESDSANIFKIGLLVFEILHNQHFRMPYLLWFQSNCNGVCCSTWQNIPWIRSWKDFSNRTSCSKVMTKFQFICKCYAITCNTCKVTCIFFLCPLVCPFKTLSILDQITSKFQRWSLTNELPVAEVLRHQYI